MPQFINCQIEDNNSDNNPNINNNSSQTSPINYSQDEIAAAMTLIDLSASPRSIAKRMLAEDLVQKGIGFPNSNDSQAQTKAQAEVANNLVQQIKKKREAVAIQQQILSNQILQQTQILQRLSSNDMDTSENGNNSNNNEEIMKQVQNFVKSTNSTNNLVGSTNSLISSAQQFQNSIKTNNNNPSVFPNPFNRQSSQLTTNTEEVNVDDEFEENENNDNNNNNQLKQQQQQLNASQAQLLLAKIQQQQQQNIPDTSLSARIASALNQNILESTHNNNNTTDQESVEISENVQNAGSSFQSPIIQMPALAGSLTTNKVQKGPKVGRFFLLS